VQVTLRPKAEACDKKTAPRSKTRNLWGNSTLRTFDHLNFQSILLRLHFHRWIIKQKLMNCLSFDGVLYRSKRQTESWSKISPKIWSVNLKSFLLLHLGNYLFVAWSLSKLLAKLALSLISSATSEFDSFTIYYLTWDFNQSPPWKSN
jgi:hypothetical protein